MKAVVEGAFVGNFDPDTYKSDRKDQKIEELTVVATGDQPSSRAPRRSPHHRRVAELHPQPHQRARQPHDADHPRPARQRWPHEIGLKCEVYSTEKLRELKMGAFSP